MEMTPVHPDLLKQMQDRLMELGEELGKAHQKIEALTAEKAALEKNAKDYVEELARVAKGTAELYKILQDSQNAGDILRNRLRKVLTAFEATTSLLQAVEAKSDKIDACREVYNKALLNLDTADNIPGTMQASPENL